MLYVNGNNDFLNIFRHEELPLDLIQQSVGF